MSRFYITLPSNSSIQYYPQNTIAQYSTKLSTPHDLNGDWEVGLCEISFPYDIENILQGECYFHVYVDGFDEPIEKITAPAGYYRNFTEVCTCLQNAQVYLVSNSILLSQDSPLTISATFKFNKKKVRVMITTLSNTSVKFSPMLARLLGYNHNVLYSGTSILAPNKMQLHSSIHSIYVYCDLVEHVSVGDTKTPLLRIINRTRGEDNVYKGFNPVQYIPLQKKSFDTIEINLMTDTGLPVPFIFGKSFVVLEFRRTAYNYFAT